VNKNNSVSQGFLFQGARMKQAEIFHKDREKLRDLSKHTGVRITHLGVKGDMACLKLNPVPNERILCDQERLKMRLTK
jgi:hypothetical protein